MSRGDTRRAVGALTGDVRALLSLRWVQLVAVVLVLLLAARVSASFLLSRVVQGLAEPRGLECGWEDLDLSLIDGGGSVSHLYVRARAAEPLEDGSPPPPLVALEYAEFDLDVAALFRGALRISRAEVDGLDTRFERAADGTWNVEEHVDVAQVLALLESSRTPAEPAEAPAPRDPASSEPVPIDLGSPITIDALRLQHARVRLVDHTVEPVLDATVEANVRLSDLRSATRPMRFSVRLSGAPLLTDVSVEGEANWRADRITASLVARAAGLHPRELARYLEPLDVRPVAANLDGVFRAEVDVSVVGAARDELRIVARAYDAHLAVDGNDELALQSAEIEVASLSTRGARLPHVRLQGGLAHVELHPNALRVLGLDLLESEGAEDGQAGAAPGWAADLARLARLWEPERWPSALALLVHPDPRAYPWTLDRFTVESSAVELVDHTVEPVAPLRLQVDEVTVTDVAHDPSRGSVTIPVSARLSAPGLMESIEVAGTVAPFAPDRSVDLALAIEGIGLRNADPYFANAGLERKLESGRLNALLTGTGTTADDGRTTGWLEIGGVAFDEGNEVYGVRSVAVRDIVLDRNERLVRLGNVEVAGPRLFFARDESHGFAAFGLRTVARAAVESSQGEPAAPTEAGDGAPPRVVAATDSEPPPEPVRFEIGRLAWTDSDLSFVDASVDPPTRLEVDELAFELRGLVLGGDPERPVPDPARLSGRLRIAGIVDELSLEGSLSSRPGPLDLRAQLAVNGTGLRGKLLAPYLAPLGIEPTLSQGRLALDVVAHVAESADGLHANLSLHDLTFTDGDTPLASLARLDVRELTAGGDGLAIAAIEVSQPFAALARDTDGAWRTGGARLVGSGAGSASAPEPAPRSVPAPLRLPALPPVTLGVLRVERARLALLDATFDPPLAREITVDATLSSLATDGSPATFEVHLVSPDVVEAGSARGEIRLGPDELGVRAAIEVTGIDARPLAPTLPPGLVWGDATGDFSVALDARVANAAEGGLAAGLEVRDVRYGPRDGDPWLACQRFAFDALRVDPAARRIELGGLFVEGATFRARRDTLGNLHALGLRVEPAADAPAAAPAPAAREGAGADEAADDALPRPAAPRGSLPSVTLADGASLELARFEVVDDALGPDARPLEGALTFTLRGPAVLLREEVGPSALDFAVSGSLAGLVERFVLEGNATPFAEQPRAALSLEVEGIRTQGAVELVPSLAGVVSGDVEDGRFSGAVAASFTVRRTRASALGFDRAFGAEIVVSDVAYRDAPDGLVLAGVDRVEIDVERVDLDRGLVHVESLRVNDLRGAVRRDAESLHALGFAVATSAPAGAPAEAPAEDAPGANEAVETPAEDATPPLRVVEAAAPREDVGADEDAAPPSEVRIDEVIASGLDFTIRDESVEPHLTLRFTRLDAEARRLSSLALVERRPVQFSGFLEGWLSGDGDEAPTPIFQELSTAGRVALYPEPAGWTQVTLEGLELSRLSPLAQQDGITLEDGALDAGVRVRLKGSRGAAVDTSLVFTDLAVEEPEGGPIERLLSLPVTLDTALFLTRNQSGEHRFSVGVDVDASGVSTGALVLAATGALAEIMARAVAGAPLRLVGSLVPGGGNRKEKEPDESWTLAFSPGAAELAPDDRERLRSLARRMSGSRELVAVLRAELTEADLERAELLANPSREECLELVAGLRQRKAELQRRLGEIATRSRVYYSVGSTDAERATQTLRDVANELYQVETALDRTLEILRSSSQRQQQKRTRSTARMLARLRIEEAASILRAGIRGPIEERLELRSPRVEPVEGQGGGRVVIELRDR